ncbi:MAG: DUF1987 domain-containing protein [Microscillaceae bacterium]|jgi:hypothetical protein|nr:DUF1987 domain-containing protein [Microscillaceae bacterium]
MEDIVIPRTTKTPAVNFNFEENRLEIAGVSIPEDADHFYTPLLDWVNEYVELKKNQPTTIYLRLIYFNTSTSDYLVSILRQLKSLKSDELTLDQIIEKEEEIGDEDEVKNEDSEATADEVELKQPEHPLRIEWHYEEEDEDMRETGTHFESIIELPFHYEAVEEIV